MGCRAFAVAGSHNLARHRHADSLADGEGGGACGVEAVDPWGWFGGVAGEGEVCGVERGKVRREKVEEQEDEGDPLSVHDLEIWAGVGDSIAKVGDVMMLVALLRVSAVVAFERAASWCMRRKFANCFRSSIAIMA